MLTGEMVEKLVTGCDAMLEVMRNDYKDWSDRANSLRPERYRDENGESVSCLLYTSPSPRD